MPPKKHHGRENDYESSTPSSWNRSISNRINICTDGENQPLLALSNSALSSIQDPGAYKKDSHRTSTVIIALLICLLVTTLGVAVNHIRKDLLFQRTVAQLDSSVPFKSNPNMNNSLIEDVHSVQSLGISGIENSVEPTTPKKSAVLLNVNSETARSTTAAAAAAAAAAVIAPSTAEEAADVLSKGIDCAVQASGDWNAKSLSTCAHDLTKIFVSADLVGKWPVGFSWTLMKDSEYNYSILPRV